MELAYLTIGFRMKLVMDYKAKRELEDKLKHTIKDCEWGNVAQVRRLPNFTGNYLRKQILYAGQDTPP